jgi:hypothetical protein
LLAPFFHSLHWYPHFVFYLLLFFRAKGSHLCRNGKVLSSKSKIIQICENGDVLDFVWKQPSIEVVFL